MSDGLACENEKAARAFLLGGLNWLMAVGATDSRVYGTDEFPVARLFTSICRVR